jgi:predicted transcriptional regulator
MTTTTLRLPEDLTRRVAAVAEGTGQSAHAFMLDAIERQTRLAQQRRGILADALAAREEAHRSGLGYPADEVDRYMQARARGEKPSRPQPQEWRSR